VKRRVDIYKIGQGRGTTREHQRMVPSNDRRAFGKEPEHWFTSRALYLYFFRNETVMYHT
jgi:hypothetical protein